MSPGQEAAPTSTFRLVLGLFVLLAAFPDLAAAAPASMEATAALERGDAALRTGDFSGAEARFREAERGFADAGDSRNQAITLQRLAEAQQALGRPGEAVATLERAAELAESGDDAGLRARILGSLGAALVAAGEPVAGIARLGEAAELAGSAGLPALEGAIRNNQANQRAERGDPAGALPGFQRALAAARRAGDVGLTARTGANGARAALAAGQLSLAADLLAHALADAQALPVSVERAYLFANLGRSQARLAAAVTDGRDEWLRRAHESLHESAKTAHATGSARTESYAWGYMGELYERQGRHEEALELTRRALFAAQRADAPESLYRWQWQLGRVQRATGDEPAALDAYREAVRTLETIRPELSRGPGGASRFREDVGAVYFELVDLLLHRSDATQDPGERAALLADTRRTLESLKKAELRDYFRDECVDALEQKQRSLDEVAGDAVVVYPVVLEDRLELLVTLPGSRLDRFTVPVGREQLTREIGRLRRMLEKRTTRQYLEPAQRLYSWIITPIEPALSGRNVSAVVFVPDGPLRLIPMTALHDGERFLVERFPVAVAPGLDLIDPRPLDRDDLHLLASGLSEERGGFAALGHVPEEVRSLARLHGGSVLLDQDFTLEGVRSSLADQQVTVLHIASHGQFASNVEDTYVLTYDDRLTMERLGDYVGLLRFRDRPLELLTLSACETAAGDERAALGLAGIAIRAGARSALGTLWKVNDAATARLVVDFYQELRDPTVSRALALQRAQKRMLGDRRYRHPSYWSAFLLISNWL